MDVQQEKMEKNEDDTVDSVNNRMVIDTCIGVEDNLDRKTESRPANSCNPPIPDIINEISTESSKSVDAEIIITNGINDGKTLQENPEMTLEANLENINKKNVEIMEAVIKRISEDKLEDNLETTRISGRQENSKGFQNKKKTPTAQLNNSLGIIATAYCDSDSDDEAESLDDERQVVEEVSIPNDKNAHYRDKDSSAEVDSEDDSSSSSSSESNSSSTSSAESEGEDDAKADECKRTRNKKLQRSKEKGEYDNLPPIEDLKISVPEVLCDPLGVVGWMVDQLVVVTPKPNKPTLNIDTVLFVEKGQRVLGRIFDVFGQVLEPHYCVRFNDAEHIMENDIKIGMTVYFCPNTPYTSLVFMSELLKIKASDEVGEEEHPEFSDDEQERAYFATLKQTQNNNSNGMNTSKPDNSEVPCKRFKKGPKTGWRSQHPWNSNRKDQYQNNSRPRVPNYNFAYQQALWRPPMDYSQSGWTPQSLYPNWPGPFGPQPRSHFPSQAFQSTSTPTHQPRMNFPRQQMTQYMNSWNIPPPPPPPNV